MPGNMWNMQYAVGARNLNKKKGKAVFFIKKREMKSKAKII